MTTTRTINTYTLSAAGLCVALGVLIPMAFHSVADAGRIFLPMHIPVILCGMLCGWRLGLLCGVLTPWLSLLLTGMPVVYPMAVVMTFELAVYAVIAALLVRRNTQFALIAAMVAGRVVSALVQVVLWGLVGTPFALKLFLSGTFVTALPGIAIQLAVIPLIMAALQKINLGERQHVE